MVASGVLPASPLPLIDCGLDGISAGGVLIKAADAILEGVSLCSGEVGVPSARRGKAFF